MPNSSKIPKITNHTRRIVPAEDIPFLGGYINEYYQASNWLMNHQKILIEKILETAGRTIAFPMETNLIENYLSGFKLNFTPFDNSASNAPNVEGWWEWDNKVFGVANIFYNVNCSMERQRFTRIHESFHVCQSLDTELLGYLDYLTANSILPKELVVKLLEKATNKATAMYLMPNNYFMAKYKEIQSMEELSTYFRVSSQALIYRLQELRLPIR